MEKTIKQSKSGNPIAQSGQEFLKALKLPNNYKPDDNAPLPRDEPVKYKSGAEDLLREQLLRAYATDRNELITAQNFRHVWKEDVLRRKSEMKAHAIEEARRRQEKYEKEKVEMMARVERQKGRHQQQTKFVEEVGEFDYVMLSNEVTLSKGEIDTQSAKDEEQSTKGVLEQLEHDNKDKYEQLKEAYMSYANGLQEFQTNHRGKSVLSLEKDLDDHLVKLFHEKFHPDLDITQLRSNVKAQIEVKQKEHLESQGQNSKEKVDVRPVADMSSFSSDAEQEEE